MSVWPAFLITGLAALSALVPPALAHGGAEVTAQTAWSAWRVTPDVVIPTMVIASVYGAGMMRRRAVTISVPWWRHGLFFAGLAAVFVSLQSPVDPVAERLFSVHQIQHLLLRMLGPMLLALSWPEGLLTAGLPAPIRRAVLAPVISDRTIRAIFRFIAHPAIATILFIGALYFWQIPRYHNLALLNGPVHYLMHATMFVVGLIFWWRVFDRRPPRSVIDTECGDERWWRLFERRPAPYGLSYGVRLMMLWVVILSNIVLGSYTALKTTVLYGGYDVLGRLFGYSALGDEQLGGIIIWIPSSMMCLVAVLIVIHLWGLHETRLDERRTAQFTSNSAALLYPATGAALIERARPKNRAMAIGFSVFVFTVFATAILLGVLYNLTDTVGIDVEARGGLVTHAAGGGSPMLRWPEPMDADRSTTSAGY